MDIDIRQFRASDIAEVVSLFYETVHAVNKRDYAQEQLDAWAARGEEANRAASWLESLTRNRSYVAEIGGELAGFGDMTHEGHLDRLYVHKDYQRRGIASLLAGRLEADARELGSRRWLRRRASRPGRSSSAAGTACFNRKPLFVIVCD